MQLCREGYTSPPPKQLCIITSKSSHRILMTIFYSTQGFLGNMLYEKKLILNVTSAHD